MPEDRTSGAAALPARRTGSGAVVRLCAPAPRAKAPAPITPAEPAGVLFDAARIEEIAQGAEALADRCLAEAECLPAERTPTLLELVGLGYATAWQLRAGTLRY